jgi:hypothetical protein
MLKRTLLTLSILLAAGSFAAPAVTSADVNRGPVVKQLVDDSAATANSDGASDNNVASSDSAGDDDSMASNGDDSDDNGTDDMSDTGDDGDSSSSSNADNGR